MNITEIIKNAFIFPSKNLETLSIFAILTLLSGAFTFEGIVTFIFGIVDISNFVIGAVYIIISFIIGLVVQRISLDCIKSGIELQDKFPEFNWWESLRTGFNKIIISAFYIIVPALIIIFIALITNVIGGVLSIGEMIYLQIPSIIMGNSEAAAQAISNASLPLFISLAITISAGLIIYLIFIFFQAMSEARYAHTGSLKKALNIYRSAKDLKRIGFGKVVLLSVLIYLIFIVIEIALTLIFNQFTVLSILTIVITPYIALFAQRALGLLYSDIV